MLVFSTHVKNLKGEEERKREEERAKKKKEKENETTEKLIRDYEDRVM